MIAGVVLDEAVEPADRVAVAEHGFDADDLLAGATVADQVDAAGIGGNGAADGRGLARPEIDRVAEIRACRGQSNVAQDRARCDGDLPSRDVDIADICQPAQC